MVSEELLPSQLDELKVEEHRRRVAEKLAKVNKVEDSKVDKAEERRQKIHDVRDQEHEVFKALADVKDDSYRSLVSDAYSEMDANVDMVIGGISYGTIIEGRGGTGKTYRVLNKCLKECGVDEVAYTDSFTTPAAFYVWLFKNKDKRVLIVDDCAGFMNSDKILSFIKGATWPVGSTNQRVVSYLTTKPLKDEFDDYVPSTIEIEARMIVITNFLDDDSPHVKAVLSRINRIRVDVPRNELLHILGQIIKKEYKGLSFEERKEALQFMTENTTNQTDDMNIRTLLHIMDYQIYAKQKGLGDVWKTLSLKLLQRDDRMVLVEKLLSDENFLNEEERYTRFIDLTGDSRATWYRLRKKVERLQKERVDAIAMAEKVKGKKGPVVD